MIDCDHQRKDEEWTYLGYMGTDRGMSSGQGSVVHSSIAYVVFNFSFVSAGGSVLTIAVA